MKERVLEFIASCSEPPPGQVERLALDLYRWQVGQNKPYAALARGCRPRTLQEVPAVPVALFRDVPLTCFPPEEAALRFHTSGTTSGRPGVHLMRTTEVYDLAARRWFHEMAPAAPVDAISLVPPPSLAPRSSLSHMVGLLYPGATWVAGAAGAVDVEAAWHNLARADEPLFVAATALSLALLLDGTGEARLPPGSTLMVTGGFKGRHLSLEPEELIHEAARRLGGELLVLGEYGMTELSSQLWTHPRPAAAASPAGPFIPPPWLVPCAVDPGSGSPLPHGRRGQLRFVDLANHETVLAIETMDMGSVARDGSVTLEGRLPGAPPRGCSLTVEEALGLPSPGEGGR